MARSREGPLVTEKLFNTIELLQGLTVSGIQSEDGKKFPLGDKAVPPLHGGLPSLHAPSGALLDSGSQRLHLLPCLLIVRIYSHDDPPPFEAVVQSPGLLQTISLLSVDANGIQKRVIG